MDMFGNWVHSHFSKETGLSHLIQPVVIFGDCLGNLNDIYNQIN